MTDPPRPTLSDYWAARARSSFWLTREVSYRLGAVLAWLLGRAGLTPNAVSSLSLLTAIAGLAAALWAFPPGVPQAIAIFVVLNLSYALDCADGLIARAHGLGTRFGAFYDKFVDVLVLAAMVGMLGSAAGDGRSGLIALPAALGVAFALGVRLALCALIWLREFEGQLPERAEEDMRPRSAGWRLRRGSGWVCDQVFYILVISVSWGCGRFWDALWIYHGTILLISGGYLAAIYRENS